MDQGKKSLLLILLVVVLGGAAALLLMRQSRGTARGVERIDASEKIWLMCMNPNCKANYEHGKKAYFEYVQNNRVGPQVPGMECPECGKNSAVRAVKCGQCGHLFRHGAKGLDFADRCPKCRYSKLEQDRKAREGKGKL